MKALAQRIKALTDELVRMNSISYAGQRETADFLYEYLRGSKYFSNKKTNLIKIQTGLPDNPYSILAFYESPKQLRETIILCGHIDTVGIAEYGEQGAIAFNQEELIPWLKERFPSDAELIKDTESGLYYFGRGALDMKGAVAMLIETFLAICEASEKGLREAFPWNAILLLTCDEEGNGAGVRSTLPYLSRLKDEAMLKFQLLINADFAHTGDNEPVPIFFGTIGKVLLGLSVFGIETHAGAPFEGVNPNALLSSIIAYLECNPKLTQHVKGEFTPPPTVLSIKGSQDVYSVKTLSEAHAYVNLFFMHPQADKLMNKVVNEVRTACKLHLRSLKKRHQSFLAKKYEKIKHELHSPELITFHALLKRLIDKFGRDDLSKIIAGQYRYDYHAFWDSTVHSIVEKVKTNRAMVVVSFIPPFYAPYAMRLDPKMNKVFEHLREFARRYKGEKLQIRQFYPFISDMSFLHPLKTQRAWEFLQQMPIPDEFLAECGEEKFSNKLSIPTINIGPIGKGAHSVKERVNLPFLTEKLPRIYIDMVSHLTGTIVNII